MGGVGCLLARKPVSHHEVSGHHRRHVSARATAVGEYIEVLIKFLEAMPQIPSVAMNIIKIVIPKNGGHFERRAAIGRRNTAHHSYIAVSGVQ